MAKRWEIANARRSNPEQIRKWLLDGWEPFAVAPDPGRYGDDHWVYFRRQVGVPDRRATSPCVDGETT